MVYINKIQIKVINQNKENNIHKNKQRNIILKTSFLKYVIYVKDNIYHYTEKIVTGLSHSSLVQYGIVLSRIFYSYFFPMLDEKIQKIQTNKKSYKSVLSSGNFSRKVLFLI